jgi:hypothetical protein
VNRLNPLSVILGAAAGVAMTFCAVAVVHQAGPAGAAVTGAYHRPAACEAGSFVTDGRHSLNYYGHLQPGVTDMTLLYWAQKCSKTGFWPQALGLYVDRGSLGARLPKMRLWTITFPWWPPAGL